MQEIAKRPGRHGEIAIVGAIVEYTNAKPCRLRFGGKLPKGTRFHDEVKRLEMAAIAF
jgi:hypothetical protein